MYMCMFVYVCMYYVSTYGRRLVYSTTAAEVVSFGFCRRCEVEGTGGIIRIRNDDLSTLQQY